MFTLDEDDEETEYGDSFKNYKRGPKLDYIKQLDPSGSSSDDAFTPEQNSQK